LAQIWKVVFCTPIDLKHASVLVYSDRLFFLHHHHDDDDDDDDDDAVTKIIMKILK
jgi:hypothetical protein